MVTSAPHAVYYVLPDSQNVPPFLMAMPRGDFATFKRTIRADMIERVFVGRGGIIVICDEDGLPRHRPLNPWLRAGIVGTAILANEDFGGLIRSQIEFAQKHLIDWTGGGGGKGGTLHGLGGAEDEPEHLLLARLNDLLTRAEQTRNREAAVSLLMNAGNLLIAVEETMESHPGNASPALVTALRVVAERMKNLAGRHGVPPPPLRLYGKRAPRLHGLGGLGVPPKDDDPSKPRLVSLKDILPPAALRELEQMVDMNLRPEFHRRGRVLTLSKLKALCHKYAEHLDAKGVDPTYLAYFLAHNLGAKLD